MSGAVAENVDEGPLPGFGEEPGGLRVDEGQGLGVPGAEPGQDRAATKEHIPHPKFQSTGKLGA